MTDAIRIEREANAPSAATATSVKRLAFERLLADLSARFANVPGDQLETEIESALKEFLDFLGFDRSAFYELSQDGSMIILCAVAREGLEPLSRGPLPVQLPWFFGEIRAGRMVVMQSLPEDLPPEAVGEAEYVRIVGMLSHLNIPFHIRGRVIGGIGFDAFHETRAWPDDVIARFKLLGEVFAQALVRKRSDEQLLAAAAALNSAQSELARAARLTTMGEMAASIAHEINQPLAAIVIGGNAGLRWLERATPDLDEVRASLKQIVSDGRRASAVIGSIRAMFKTGSEEKVPIDVNELIREALTLVHSQLKGQRVLVQTELAERLPPTPGNRVQLQQVIVNLTTNAIEAMSSVTDREPILRVRSEVRDSHDLLITVEDSGAGIDPKSIDRVFDAFFTTKSDGMGMGLAICRSIVEAHHGRLWAEPGVRQGSVFRLLLPIAPSPDAYTDDRTKTAAGAL